METYWLVITYYASLVGATLMVAWLLHWVYKWMNPPCRGTLPPGSMGLPILGESIQFFKMSSSLDIPDFYKTRLTRYGPIFKTSLFGQPLVVSADPEVNRFIFQHEGKMFRSWYPEAANIIIGEETIEGFHGAPHKFIRNSIYKIFGIEYLKHHILPELEAVIRKSFGEWADKFSIDVHDSTPDMIIDLVAKKLVNLNPEESRELTKNYCAFLQGLISFPLYFPGTTFYQCMQGRKNMQKIMSGLLRKRLNTADTKYGDFLDLIVEELQSEKPMIDEKFATDALAALLFTSFVTLAPILTLAFKFLSDNPKVLKSLEDEHESILKNKSDANSGFTWEDYKSLTFTTMVVNELTRMSNATPGVFRKTVKDVEVNGYTIPSGWMVMICPMAVHVNPDLFEHPLCFNPWRWQDESKRSTLLKNFMPFGLGIRTCPATDFSKLFTAMFLHVLVTKYRWKKINGGEVSRMGVIIFPNGYKIQLLPRT